MAGLDPAIGHPYQIANDAIRVSNHPLKMTESSPAMTEIECRFQRRLLLACSARVAALVIFIGSLLTGTASFAKLGRPKPGDDGGIEHGPYRCVESGHDELPCQQFRRLVTDSSRSMSIPPAPRLSPPG